MNKIHLKGLLFYVVMTTMLAPQFLKGQSKGNESDRPNIVVILADDLGFGDLGFNGSKQLLTPNLDALAASGIDFEQGYVSAPVCSPSRAGMLTGKNQVEFGFDNNLSTNQMGFDPAYRGLPVSEKTIVEYLGELGYVTGLIGKWHLGYAPQFHPTKRGFDEFWGYLAGGHDYFRSESDGKGYLAPIQCNFKTPGEITYLTDDKGSECVDFVRRHKGEPFFLFASFNAPHTPMQALGKDLELFAHIEDEKRRTYAAMVYRLDVNVGRIVKALETEGLREKTLIVFLSDNGGPVDSNGSCNAPYNGQKGILLEGGVHVPFVISWPGTLPKGKKYQHPVSSLDLAPTFLSLAGGKVSPNMFSGVNLMPFVKKKGHGDKPHESLKWRFTISGAILEDGWKLIRLPDRLPMLYHLPTDMSEQKDLSMENLEKTEELLGKLGQWDVGLPHPLFLEGAEWKKRQLQLYDATYPLEQPVREK
ncbi:MAG: sulfatase-like hydrolase/transferase [Flavobacteriaceae bacterium]